MTTQLHAIAAQQHVDDLHRLAEQHRRTRQADQGFDARHSLSHKLGGRLVGRSLVILGLRRSWAWASRARQVAVQ
ncbi:MAG: hypothetical protein QOE31_425 [Solirubrobacteraceae bacterium]|nr:hypothetical protein [Solirubrobacteraceae bacterium]